jgi:hypothetical protein
LRRELETEQWDRYQPSYVGKTEDRRRQHGICRSRGGAVRSTQPIHTTRGSVLGGMVSEGAVPIANSMSGESCREEEARSARSDLLIWFYATESGPISQMRGRTSFDIRPLEWRSCNGHCALSAVRQNCASEDQAAMR